MILEDAELGTIKLIANARARRIIVRYRNGQFHLTHPTSISTKEIKKTVQEMKPKLKVLKDKALPKIVFTEDTVFNTLTFKLSLQPNLLNNTYTSLKDGVLTISYPQSIVLESEEMQSFVRETIENICRVEANRILPNRVIELSQMHGFKVGSVKINKSRGRWGSCSSKKNINLSYFCMMLPEYLIDFIILHELCHTKEMNHGIRFWALLDSVSEYRAKELTEELKRVKLHW